MSYRLALVACAGCTGVLDPSWQLDHDRLVAVRATPPHVAAGQVAVLDALVAHAGAPTDAESPIAVTADAASGLSDAVRGDGVVGPDDDALDRARAALGLAPGAPVPLEVQLQFPDSNGHPLYAVKTVWLGDAQDNPTLGVVTIGDAAPGAAVVVAADVDVTLAIDVAAGESAAWLTSCGTLHDDDEPTAILHVTSGDRDRGELAVVLRDASGGVAWQVWPIQAVSNL